MLKSPPQDSVSTSIGSVSKICESCVMGTGEVSPHQGPSLQSESHRGEGVNSPCLLDSFQISHISPVLQWSSARLALAQPSRQPLLNEYELLKWLQTTSCVALGKSFDFSRHLFQQILTMMKRDKVVRCLAHDCRSARGSSYHFQDLAVSVCWYPLHKEGLHPYSCHNQIPPLRNKA